MTAPLGGVAWTPGPWVIETTENPHIDGAHWRQVRAGEHGPVLGEVFRDLGDPDPGLSDADAEANARLIAAAPELYEAVHAFVDRINGGSRADTDYVIGLMSAALAKADGAAK